MNKKLTSLAIAPLFLIMSGCNDESITLSSEALTKDIPATKLVILPSEGRIRQLPSNTLKDCMGFSQIFGKSNKVSFVSTCFNEGTPVGAAVQIYDPETDSKKYTESIGFDRCRDESSLPTALQGNSFCIPE